jgi:hypothetical protein
MKIKCIALSNGGVTWIYPEDFEKLNYWRWNANREESVRRRDALTGRTVLMHREILGLEYGDGTIVDHINHNPFDNRRQNLRIVTSSQNACNRSGDDTGRGVYLSNPSYPDSKWHIRHKLNGKNIYGGTYDTFEEADMAAREWRRIHMPYSHEDAQ